VSAVVLKLFNFSEEFSCSEIEAFTPFPPISNHTSTHTTYLDTTGRPALTFAYRHLTDKHAGVIYVRGYTMFLDLV